MFAAALHVFAIVRSVAVPPKSLAPPGSRALRLNSNASYFCFRFGSFVSTCCTADADAAVTSYTVTGVPSSGLKTVTGR